MRAAIDENGQLTITAESGLESFALQRWIEGFNRPQGQQLTTIAVSYATQAGRPWPIPTEGAPEVKA